MIWLFSWGACMPFHAALLQLLPSAIDARVLLRDPARDVQIRGRNGRNEDVAAMASF